MERQSQETCRHGTPFNLQVSRTRPQGAGKKQQERASRENREIPFDGGKVVYNFEEDRLQILFDKIPDTDMRTTLKRNAFKWAPRNQAWQRQLTRNAEYAAGQVLKITI